MWEAGGELKGKEWTVDEERQLRKYFEDGRALLEISTLLEKSPEAVRAKLKRLVIGVDKHASTEIWLSTSNVILPEELISLEDTLKMLVASLKMSCSSGLTKLEIHRLEVVAMLARTYSDKLLVYLNLKGLEQRLFELESKYSDLAKKTLSKKVESDSSSA